ncbi:MAG TPA: ABC transporter substrate-binding protein [Microvirga sp.]|jgi:dipeptide transport system substrate-binding protein
MRRVSQALALAGALLWSGTAAAKTFVFCSEGNPEALNPQLVTTTTGMNASRPVYNNLVEFAPGSTTIVPSLAESWTVSPDGLEYTFRLRSGVQFHANRFFTPSRPLNADDVIFSIVRQWKADHPYHAVSGTKYDYFQDLGMADLLQAVEKLDDRTVRIRLARPDSVFLANLAMPFNVVLSAEYGAAMLKAGTPDRLDQEPIGTGPFEFVSYQKDVAIRFKAFRAFWGAEQAISALVFAITPNASVRLTKLKAGECHAMAFPSPGDAARIAADPTLTLMRQEGLNIGYMALNTSRPPFTDVRVRRAINMAIEKDAIIEAVYQGAGVVAKNPVPPTLWSYNVDVRDYPYDPAEARRLLGEAGYPEGFETDLWYMPVSRPYNPNGKRIAEMIQADLAKVGIRLRLVTDEWSLYRARLQAGEATMALYGWTGDNGDPDNFLHLLLGCTAARIGGNNIARWCHRDYDALVTEAKVRSDQSERDALYRRAQVIAKDEAPWVPLAHSVVFMAARREVTGFVMDPLGRHIFDRVDLKP